MNKKVKREIIDLFNSIKYKDNYTFEDYFGPIDNNCMQIDANKTKVVFIDKVTKLENVLKQYFINSKYIGIDTEWQQSMTIKDEINLSIMQLSTDDDKCCIILDMLELKEDKRFIEMFKKYFTGKIFVGFSFDKNDLEVLPLELKNFFEDTGCCTVYDLVLIYQQKYLEKCSSLKAVSEELLGKSMCKIEQCSDWNIRPLSKCQMHYAALDALICIKLYKKLVDNL
jgi:ribonuclease D